MHSPGVNTASSYWQGQYLSASLSNPYLVGGEHGCLYCGTLSFTIISYYHLRICTLAIPPTPAAGHPEPGSLPRSPPGISPRRFQSLDAPLATSRGGSNRRRAFPLTSTRNTSL